MVAVVENKLLEFSEIFATDVFPFYKQHEETFDVDGIHGVLHIGRSLVASYILSKKCNEFGLPSNTTDVLIATAFHDSGRKNGGKDFWETFSAKNCEEFLKKKEFNGERLTKTPAEQVASYIVKRGQRNSEISSTESVDFMCVYDADVLEIMRPCCGCGGRNSFDQSRLLLYVNDYNFYQYYGKLINEWSQFILDTEEVKKELSTTDCIYKLFEFIESNKVKYPTIYSALHD